MGRDLTKWEVIACSTAGAAAAVLSYGLSASPAVAVLSGYLFFTAAAITLIDSRLFIIPNELSLPAIPIGMIAMATASADYRSMSNALLSSLLGAAVGGGSFYLLRAVYRRLRGFEGLGMGDVKLAAAAGAWVGLEA